jgi:succinate-semialdehyde dehydrogenase / glutarate-semialdehyde dehydrogenase
MNYALSDVSLLRNGAYVDGTWIKSTPHGSYALHNPATGKILAELPRFRVAETRMAIDAAGRAFQSWKKTSAKQRSDLIHRWYELILLHREDLATIITLEQGKPLPEARAEVDYAASFLQWFAEEAKRVYGDVVPAPRTSQRILVIKQPIGVCAAITPWNFPAAMITRKAGPALAAGCTMVVKPASQTPLTALALADLAERAGVPSGVFNVVTGNDTRAIGNELTSNPQVRKLTFTGSTEVGRILLRQSAETIKKCSMELGGNAPFIVFDDADLDAAADGVIACKFRNTGQACISANRVLVQDGIYDTLATKVVERVRQLRIGNGLEAGVQLGPLIDDAAVAKVEEHIADARARGGRVLTGGQRHALGGRFFEATVLTNVTAGMLISVEETFGPVAPLFRFNDEAEAIELANATEYGLAAYLYARDHARIWRVAEALECGMIGINCGLISNEVAPFGGVKQSGLGREGSRYGIDEFLEMKYLSWDGIGPA